MAISEPPIYTPSVKITVGEFIDNIEKNGWTQTFGEVFNSDSVVNEKVDKDKVTEACAFGQGMLNSDIFLLDEASSYTWRALYKDISRWNDLDQHSIPTIASLAREKYADRLDEELTGWNYEDYSNGRAPVGHGLNRG